MYSEIAPGIVGSPFMQDLKLPDVKLTKAQSTAPGMLSYQERSILHVLASQHYRGDGAIIDGGSFFGSSLVASASGLEANPNLENMDLARFPGGKAIHGYELGFLPAPKSDKIDKNRVFSGIPYVLGDNFVHILEETIKAHTQNIDLHIGDLNDEVWPGDPIEICFIDVCKTMRLNAHVSKQFYPSMIGGNSILINQDFFFDRLPWIKVTMGYLKDYYRWEGQVHTSSVYTSIKDVPQDVADMDPFLEGTYEECLAFHDATEFPKIDRKSQYFMALSRGYLMALKDRKSDALEHLRATSDTFEDILNDTEENARGNQFRMDRAVRQITNGNIFKVS